MSTPTAPHDRELGEVPSTGPPGPSADRRGRCIRSRAGTRPANAGCAELGCRQPRLLTSPDLHPLRWWRGPPPPGLPPGRWATAERVRCPLTGCPDVAAVVDSLGRCPWSRLRPGRTRGRPARPPMTGVSRSPRPNGRHRHPSAAMCANNSNPVPYGRRQPSTACSGSCLAARSAAVRSPGRSPQSTLPASARYRHVPAEHRVRATARTSSVLARSSTYHRSRTTAASWTRFIPRGSD